MRQPVKNGSECSHAATAQMFSIDQIADGKDAL